MIAKTTQRRRLGHVSRLLIATAASMVIGLCGATYASGVVNRSAVASFGPDGTAGTSFNDQLNQLAFQQGTDRLYALNREPEANRFIYGFDASVPFAYTPLAAPFPLSIGAPGTEPGLAVDNTALPSAGNIYYSSRSAGTITGFNAAGGALGAPFPLSPPAPKTLCANAVDPEGNIAVANNNATAKSEGRGVLRFSPAGAELPPVNTVAQPGNPCRVAFDANGDLFVGSLQGEEGGEVWKYTKASGYTSSSTVTTSRANAIAVDTSNGHLFTARGSAIREFDSAGSMLHQFGTGFGIPNPSGYEGIAVNEATNEVYAADNNTSKKIRVFGPPAALPSVTTQAATATSRNSITVAGQVNLDGGPEVTECLFQYATNPGFTTAVGTTPCSPATPYAGDTAVSAVLTTLSPATTYSFRLVAKSANGTATGGILAASTPPAIKDIATLDATNVTVTGATLNGSLDPDGIPTTYYFQYGQQTSYGSFAPASPPGASAGEAPGVTPLSAGITGLQPGKTYNYRLVGVNSFGTTLGANKTFFTSGPPSIENDVPGEVNTDAATFHADINPNGLTTTYHFEYGLDDCEVIVCTSSPDGPPLEGAVAKPASYTATGLQSGQTYFFRVVASNQRGTTVGQQHLVKTYVPDSGTDSCSNAIVRQQTGASLLRDCRAYELVSAPNAGGFDVASDLAPGQAPLAFRPHGSDRALYSISFGTIPGIAGSPTNFGGDPYLAERGEDGWSTEYVGLPSDGMTQVGAFGSPILGSGADLRTFAFGGEEVCNPCFADGSTNVPLRLPNGALVKGMAGSLDPAADPAGYVARPLSADGSHFIFGSEEKFEPAGNEGEITIYDRDLDGGTTQVASTLPNGTTMSGQVGQLDVSADGSRVVVATEVSTDSAGNSYWHPYMHIGTSAGSVDLAPGTVSGVLFAGMAEDGSKVFFATSDKLLAADTDDGADLYEAGVDGAGSLDLNLVSTSNSEACDPAPNADGNHWNALGVASDPGCGVLTIAGGGGVARDSGTVYFLSPEKLDGSGVLDEPNLFVAEPGGTPELVATLEPDNSVVRNGLSDSEAFRSGDFQVAPGGQFALFDSTLPLTGFQSLGHEQIYRHDAEAGEIACVSCAPTFAAPSSDTILSEYGSNLSDDGRVFFTTSETLALRDTNGRGDAYEWSGGSVQLISRGIGPENSGLLSVSGDGTNAFFFTREKLVPEDENGSALRIYVARSGGGYLYDPPPFSCAASDECHGPGTQQPSPPNINTQLGSGREPRFSPPSSACPKGKVRRKGKCRRRARSRSQQRSRAQRKQMNPATTKRHG